MFGDDNDRDFIERQLIAYAQLEFGTPLKPIVWEVSQASAHIINFALDGISNARRSVIRFSRPRVEPACQRGHQATGARSRDVSPVAHSTAQTRVPERAGQAVLIAADRPLSERLGATTAPGRSRKYADVCFSSAR